MLILLIYIGLITIPFAHLSGIVDQAWLKEYISFSLAISIVFYSLYTKGIKCINNKWLLLTISAMLISTAFVPDSGLKLGALNPKGAFIFVDMNINNMWNFKPILLAIIYLLMVCAITQENWNIKHIARVICWVGFIMAIVVIVQKAGFQQFWRIKDASEIGPGSRNLELTGFMAQYTLVSAFMAICFVSALYIKEIYLSIVIAIAIFMTQSHFAILSISTSFVLWATSRNKKIFLASLFSMISVSLILAYLLKFNDNGRYGIWLTILHDMTHPLYDIKMAQSQGFTGFGSGSFSVFFPIIHQSPWGKAHNEFIEFLFNNGIFGLILLITSISVFIKQCFHNFDNPEIRFGLITFISICMLSCGTFPWHLGWGQFYTAVIVGLTYSEIRKADNNGLVT